MSLGLQKYFTLNIALPIQLARALLKDCLLNLIISLHFERYLKRVPRLSFFQSVYLNINFPFNSHRASKKWLLMGKDSKWNVNTMHNKRPMFMQDILLVFAMIKAHGQRIDEFFSTHLEFSRHQMGRLAAITNTVCTNL